MVGKHMVDGVSLEKAIDQAIKKYNKIDYPFVHTPAIAFLLELKRLGYCVEKIKDNN